MSMGKIVELKLFLQVICSHTNDIKLHLTYPAVKPDGDPVVVVFRDICPQEIVNKLSERWSLLAPCDNIPEINITVQLTFTLVEGF